MEENALIAAFEKMQDAKTKTVSKTEMRDLIESMRTALADNNKALAVLKTMLTKEKLAGADIAAQMIDENCRLILFIPWGPQPPKG